jgi:hypothetical protein
VLVEAEDVVVPVVAAVVAPVLVLVVVLAVGDDEPADALVP